MEAANATAWQPRSKPIWFTELGCPAVDKGANQPNVFFDPKSAQSALPYFSSGSRDDLIQRNYIEAFQRFLDTDHPYFAGSNPISPIYGGPMVDPAHLHLWTWDARPYPHFPDLTNVWSDGANWERGHWLNGRLGTVTLAALIEAILADHGFADYAVSAVHGSVEGYLVNEILSARNTLEPLLQAFRIDAADAGDAVLFRGRHRLEDAAIDRDAIVEPADDPPMVRTRAQETELASELTLRIIDPGKDYRIAAASSRRLAGQSSRSAAIDLTAVLDFAEAERLTNLLLQDIWTAREAVELRLPPSRLTIEAGDLLALEVGTRTEVLLAERIEDGQSRNVRLRRVDNRRSKPPRKPRRRNLPDTAPAWGPPEVRVVEFAPPNGEASHAPRIATFADPWPGKMAIYSGAEGGGFRLAATVTRPGVIGQILHPLAPGPLGVFDRANELKVTLLGGALAGLPDIDVLAGGNAAAVRTADRNWEILQFAQAELTELKTYRLARLLRGQAGTEQNMLAGAEAGADFVLLNGAITPLPVQPDSLGLPLRYRFGAARDDHAAPSFAEHTIVAGGSGLRPFAPVHLRARREDASGDIALRWIRRTRLGGDNWEAAEVPLGEESERYLAEVMDGESVKRSFDVTAAEAIYGAAQQTADWGALPASLTWRVRQWSTAYGWGVAGSRTSSL